MHIATNISVKKYYCILQHIFQQGNMMHILRQIFQLKILCILPQIFFSITAAHFLCTSRCSAWNDLWLLWLQNTSMVIINQFGENFLYNMGKEIQHLILGISSLGRPAITKKGCIVWSQCVYDATIINMLGRVHKITTKGGRGSAEP